MTITAFDGKEMMPNLKASTLCLIADSREKNKMLAVVVPCIAAKIHTDHVPIKRNPIT